MSYQKPAPAPGTDAAVALEARSRLEWSRDPELRAEFGNRVELYLAYRRAVATGRTRDRGRPAAAASPADDGMIPIEQRAAIEFDRDPSIRAEFTSKANYIAFRKAQAAGRVRICGGGVQRF